MPNNLREELAALAHDQWSGWLKHQFSKLVLNPDGTMTVPKWAVDRWTRQMNSIYADLPEDEKESDREEADRYLTIINGSREEAQLAAPERPAITLPPMES